MRRSLGLLPILVLVLGVAGLLRMRSAPIGTASPTAVHPAALPDTSEPARHATEPGRPRGPLGTAKDVRKTLEQAAELRQLARLPDGLKALDPAQPDPAAWRAPTLPPPGLLNHRDGLAIFAYAPGMEVFPGEVTIVAFALDGDDEVAPQTISGTLMATDSQATVATLNFRDDGAEGDETADDRRYTATVTLPEDRSLAGNHRATITATFANGETRTTTCAYVFNVPVARATGHATDRVEDGHLVVEIEVEAVTASRVHLQASLATAAGVPLALVEQELSLAEGTQMVPLRFWGGLLHERQAEGPYRLAHVVLRSATEPAATQRVALDYQTAAHPLTAFDPAPANNQRMLDFANQLDRRAEQLAEPR